MLNKVKSYIETHKLLDTDKRYIVALSGGADSVCLLLMLKELGYNIEAAHCNFLLRGDESYRDENFVKTLCEESQIPLHLIHFDTKTYAELHKVSIEMAARDLRYQYFEQLRKDIHADGICVAHHQDDSVETILMNLLRGTGIHGLSGIKPRHGYILRPLLCASRTEIESWLEKGSHRYVTDSTNLEADVVRNKLRLNVIPQLLDITPSAKANILKTAQHIQEATLIYDEYVKKTISRLVIENKIEIKALLSEPSPESILFHWLSNYGFSSTLIEDISKALNAALSGKEWSSDTHQLAIHQGQLLLEPKSSTGNILKIPETGTYVYSDNYKIRLNTVNNAHVIKDVNTACLDVSAISFPLFLRPTQTGDRFQPFGMKGSKLVSDYLTNKHLSVFEKRRTLVLCDKNGQILWLAGHRPDGRFCISDSTKETLIITLSSC